MQPAGSLSDWHLEGDRGLPSPFPYFGGKRRIAPLVWERFGADVVNYVEPFFGSGAVLLTRPNVQGTETVNDIDSLLSNFWRAIQADPEQVAAYAEWPVSELDLHARHRWLIETGKERIERLREDPDFFDSKVAGWWVWGIAQWIGRNWCASSWRQRPSLGKRGNGRGVLAARPSSQLPDLSGDGGATGRGVHAIGRRGDLVEWFQQLAARLRYVRICCGDWTRVLGPSVTYKIGPTAIFLDPPYSHDERDRKLYAQDHDVADDVRKWAIENGSNPLLRIAVCGYDSEFPDMPDNWTVVRWAAKGGYGGQRRDHSNTNRYREVVWFSPACHPLRQPALFDDALHPTTLEQ